MKDSLRESLSYWGLYRKMFQVKKVIIWIHGGCFWRRGKQIRS